MFKLIVLIVVPIRLLLCMILKSHRVVVMFIVIVIFLTQWAQMSTDFRLFDVVIVFLDRSVFVHTYVHQLMSHCVSVHNNNNYSD